MNQIKIYKILLLILIIAESLTKPVLSAERVTVIKGIFSRSTTTNELKDFVENGIKKDLLKRSIKKKEEEKVISFLTKEYKAPIILTSKLLSSNIGNVIISRVTKVIYPIRVKDEYTRGLAIKAAIIKALAINNEKITILSFLEAYPSKVVAINIDELYKVINKVESMSELVEFFADSPLEKLK